MKVTLAHCNKLQWWNTDEDAFCSASGSQKIAILRRGEKKSLCAVMQYRQRLFIRGMIWSQRWLPLLILNAREQREKHPRLLHLSLSFSPYVSLSSFPISLCLYFSPWRPWPTFVAAYYSGYGLSMERMCVIWFDNKPLHVPFWGVVAIDSASYWVIFLFLYFNIKEIIMHSYLGNKL